MEGRSCEGMREVRREVRRKGRREGQRSGERSGERAGERDRGQERGQEKARRTMQSQQQTYSRGSRSIRCTLRIVRDESSEGIQPTSRRGLCNLRHQSQRSHGRSQELHSSGQQLLKSHRQQSAESLRSKGRINMRDRETDIPRMNARRLPYLSAKGPQKRFPTISPPKTMLPIIAI
jgi:hypothetical protein